MALLTRARTPSSTERASAAATEAIERARVVAAPTVERAREAAGPTVERAREASRPALAQLRSAIATLLRTAVGVAALLPGLGAQVLEAIATLMGRLAETSAQIAHVEPPSKVGRRRAGLWFVGGFVTGAAAGYAAHELLAHDQDHDHAHDDEGPWVATAEDGDGAASAQVPG